MQSKKERSSAHKEASEIQSTQARNEYILGILAEFINFLSLLFPFSFICLLN